MAQVPQEEVQRNLDLVNDYKSGMNIIDLGARYRITSNRIYAILKRARMRGELVDFPKANTHS